MATSTISGKIKDPAGTALSGITVTATLKPYGFRESDGSSIAQKISTTTDASGIYSFVLERTADIQPDNSWYEIEELIPTGNGGRRVWAISVGSINASVFASLLVNPPDAGIAAQYLTQVAGDARYAAGADVAAALAHISDPTDAHAASAITNTPAGTIAAVTVQAALNELDTEKSATAHTHTQYGSLLGFSVARKTADESVTSSTVLQNDDHLTIALAANEVWVFEYHLVAVSPSGVPNIKLSLVSASSTLLSWSAEGSLYYNAAAAATVSRRLASGQTLSHYVDNVESHIGLVGILINGASSGTMVLQWAQDTSSVNATTLKSSSFVVASRIA